MAASTSLGWWEREQALCKPYTLPVCQLFVVAFGPGINALERMWDPGSVTYGFYFFEDLTVNHYLFPFPVGLNFLSRAKGVF